MQHLSLRSERDIRLNKFNQFKSIAVEAARVAKRRPNCSPRVSWFIKFALRCINTCFFYDRFMDDFFAYFPNSNFLNQFADEEALIQFVCEQIEAVVSSWTAEPSYIKGKFK